MGLDQYLHGKVYVGSKWHKSKGNIKVSKKHNFRDIKDDFKEYNLYPAKNITYIIYEVGYWRKSNWIHKWFVDNVQGGEDNCKEYKVEKEKLLELKNLCSKLVKLKDKDLAMKELPSCSGFFFGSNPNNDNEFWYWYWQDLKDTIKIIDNALAFLDRYEYDASIYYESSW